MVYICKKIAINTLLRWVGRHSIGFYFMCGGIPNIVALLMIKLSVEINFYSYIIGFIVSFVITYISVWFLNRYLPFLFDMRLLIRR